MSVQSSKRSTTSHTSRASRASRTSRASSSHSVARREALIDNATTQAAFEYEQRMIDVHAENERQQVENERQLAENERQLAENERQVAESQRQMTEKKAENERQRAANERQMSLMNASKAAAIAKAKLAAIDQAFLEECDDRSMSTDEECDSTKRTETWISNANETLDEEVTNNMPQDVHEPKDDVSTRADSDITGQNRSHTGPQPDTTATSMISPASSETVKDATSRTLGNATCHPFIPRGNHGFAGNEPAYQPHTPPPVNTSPTELRLVESIARQSLPKFEPDLFTDDVTMYYTWKNSLRAMLQDANVSPTQEIGFIRKYTSGASQKVVDSYRKRLYADPADALRDIWSALNRKFGNTAAITNAYLDQLDKMARFKDTDREKLQDFADTCADVNSLLTHLPGLMCINYANFLQPIAGKLPNYIKTKWEKIVVDHANANDDKYPTFDKFASLMASEAELKNHPSIQTLRPSKQQKSCSNDEYNFNSSHHDFTDDMRVFATTSESRNYHRDDKSCPIHNRKGHSLLDCPTFEAYTVDERRDAVYKAGLCFRCLIGQHRAADCHATAIKCSVCGSARHTKLMHSDNWYDPSNSDKNDSKRYIRDKAMEKGNANSTPKTDDKRKVDEVRTACTVICDGSTGGTSCCKILLVDIFDETSPHISRPIYALIDDQSNASMISTNLLDQMGLDGRLEKYLLTTCSNEKETKYGRRVTGLVAKSSNGTTVRLPSMLECEHIPQNKHEIATRHIAKQFPHLRDIVDEIPDVNNEAHIEILIGRDAPELLKVRAFRNGPSGAPWAQKLVLGWTISGQVCLDRMDGPVHIVAHKTVLAEGETDSGYDVTPCPNYINVKQHYDEDQKVFTSCADDDEVAFSNEDRRFINLMDSAYHKNESGNCEMPLPFREKSTCMPNNREQAMKRLYSLRRSFNRKPKMKDDYVEFMSKLFERNHAVVLSSSEESTLEDGKFWYLPHFAVYHPKKPEQIRVVFDSSAEYNGTSLNKNLMTGPDQMNNLLGILIRFRKDNIAIICDVEQMFHTFHVDEEHRNFLRFLWFENNNPNASVVECRMNVHLFGNVSSPAIATYGMRRTADEGEEEFGPETTQFVHQDFYVDDGLTSCSTETEALSLVKNTQASLKKSNLRLHKIASNSVSVMNGLPEEDRAKGIKELDLQHDTLPSLRSLGVQWNLKNDTFTFKVTLNDKPYTRRGILSVVNSVYDPIGLAAPVTIKGKIILQHFVHQDFYVDDGLTSCSTETEALSLVKNTQASLKKSNLRLHKIASNSVSVMNGLPEEDRAKGIKELDLQHDTLPSLRSLGVQWNLKNDTFTFKVTLNDKPYTRRGILSVVNSVYDPIGLAAPVTIKGKIILQHFVHQDFYVDDGLTSCSTETEALSLVKNTQASLKKSNLRLHKIASNSVSVMNGLPEEDRAKGIKELDLQHDTLPSLRSLGVQWNLKNDTFTFKVTLNDKPYTRRGILSVVNSVYDPIGLAAPVTIKGKIILQHFVHQDFYVDDGLTSCSTETEALSLVKNTQASLKKSNLRLHKIASNSVSVMNGLPEEDRAKGIKELDLQHDTLPSLRSLGVQWNLKNDTFTFKVTLNDKPYTRRGILSVVNSVYDPIGLAAPVTIKGKIILQHLTILGSKDADKRLGWDDPLPTNMLHQWESWKTDLIHLERVQTPRCYHGTTFGQIIRREIHAFSDASTHAIGVAIYLRLTDVDGQISVSLIYGQAKVAPIRLTTVPRLELCAAVMATQAVQKITKEIHQPIDKVCYYTDSKIVIGYVRNESRRFYVYVANRVQMIRNASDPSQWNYVETEINPADIASRGIRASKLMESAWLRGPDFLKESPIPVATEVPEDITNDDPDVREITINSIDIVVPPGLGTSRFERISTWNSARRAIANLTRLAKNVRTQENDHTSITPVELLKAEKLLITTLQRETFEDDLKTLNHKKSDTASTSSQDKCGVSKSSRLYKLDPFVDEDGILRVGGRLQRSDLPFNEKHPVILPKDRHLTKLIVQHYHAEVQHLARTTTLAATRKAGFWVIGGQSTISKVINSCVICRRLRGRVHTQQMADLPPDRLEVTPPFTNVGFDVFGPWMISTRKLRGGAAETKRWGLVFTCLVSRAVHIEVLESMDTSSFMCALRRFFALRGPAEILRCDRGTNFVGAKTDIDESLAQMDKQSIERYLAEHGCKWLFNPPLSSHYGGAWERMIGTIRRILDAMLLTMGRHHQLTHEMLTTLMSEVTAIVNARPITAVATDNDEPQPLSPAMLLTMKTRPYSAVPGVFIEQDMYARKRWRRTQYLADQFWVRWRREYIQNLQVRQKWNGTKRDMSVGDIVIVVEDDDVPRYKWPIGRVVEAITSEDGHVRRVKVAMWRDGTVKEYERPITKCVVLLENERISA